jgi:hypothetical protein
MDRKEFYEGIMNGTIEPTSNWEGFHPIENTLTQSQEKIVEICDAMKDLLLYKNQKYGDSALHPNNIFYKGDSTNSIKIRLDDKVGRIKNCEETRVNDVSDVIGYSVLLLASMNVTKEDIAKFKD